MKNYVFPILAMTTLLTAAQPLLAQDGTTSVKLESVAPSQIADFNMRINPQLGLSSFEHKGQKGSNHSPAFGATVELGESAMRKLETGLMIMTMGSDTAKSTYLTIPMMAKLRLLSMKAQSWYAKFGFNSAYALNSSNNKVTNKIDVLMSAGAGGRLALTRSMDFIIEGTYNRGLLDNLKGSGDEYNQGFLILAGFSIPI